MRRNAYGRQRDSFEAPLDVDDLTGGPFPGVFIRAPRIEHAGADVEVLARYDGHPVLARQGPVWVASFHPELSGDLRFHDRFLDRRVGAMSGHSKWHSIKHAKGAADAAPRQAVRAARTSDRGGGAQRRR